MFFKDFNKLDEDSVDSLLQKCCGSTRWRDEISRRLPFADSREFLHVLNDIWYNVCSEVDWKEAFMHHPEIGNMDSLREKYATSKDIAGAEQDGVNNATVGTLNSLLQENKKYKKKFGFIFIVFASGKSAEEMLALLRIRMNNSPGDELRIAMGEQQKITLKRLKELVTDVELPASHITTHILDTSSGKPAANVLIMLLKNTNGVAQTLSLGVTNGDGRISNLLPPAHILAPGRYTMHFDTGSYFSDHNAESFFPFVEITFNLTTSSHYHIPLLVSPFGYTTYRGS